MRVRDAMLVLLMGGPAHGYQLKLDYERLNGNDSLNVGQVYKTLERLQRDGLVERDEPLDDRRITYRLTAAGRAVAHDTLYDTDDRPTSGRSSLALKVLLATVTPGVDPIEIIDVHRAALLHQVQTVRRRARGRDLALTDRLVLEAEVAVAEAELRWLDVCEAELRGES